MSMFNLEIVTLARLLIDEARERSLRIVTAESCTGGLVAGAICSIPGSSDVFERGFVTYSNRAKQELLGVPGDLIADNGAVSEPVARFMAEGALANSHAHIAVSITGISGPGGGSTMRPSTAKAPRDCALASAAAATTLRAQASACSSGVNTACAHSTWRGWMQLLPTNPRPWAIRASRSNAAGSRKSGCAPIVMPATIDST